MQLEKSRSPELRKLPLPPLSYIGLLCCAKAAGDEALERLSLGMSALLGPLSAVQESRLEELRASLPRSPSFLGLNRIWRVSLQPDNKEVSESMGSLLSRILL